MTILILRSYHKDGTNGEMFVNGKRICYTIELPWKDNQRRVSCIPEGTYELAKRYTPRFQQHLHVKNVKDREWILIHRFNNALKESKGCIAPVEKLDGVGIGGPSESALNRLLRLAEPAFAKKQTVLLTIKRIADEINIAESQRANAEVF